MVNKHLIAGVLWISSGLLLTGAAGVREDNFLLLVGAITLSFGIFFTVHELKKR